MLLGSGVPGPTRRYLRTSESRNSSVALASVRLGGLNGDFETAIEWKRSCHKAVDRVIEILK